MKVFYGQNYLRQIILALAGIMAAFSIVFGIFNPEVFYLLFVSLFYTLLSFIFMINRIYVSDDEIKISFVRFKAQFKRADLKEIFVQRAGKITQMVLCFNDFSGGNNTLTISQYLKRCKSNPDTVPVAMLYDKKLFLELSKDSNVKLIDS